MEDHSSRPSPSQPVTHFDGIQTVELDLVRGMPDGMPNGMPNAAEVTPSPRNTASIRTSATPARQEESDFVDGMTYGGMIPVPVPGLPAPQREWTQPLCGCWRELGSNLCCLACWCPCIAYAETYSKVYEHRQGDECSRCLFFGLLWPGVPTAITLIFTYVYFPIVICAWLPMHSYVACFSSPLRETIRRKYSITEMRCPVRQCSSDRCVQSYCMMCSLLQERHELENGLLPPHLLDENGHELAPTPIGQVMRGFVPAPSPGGMRPH